MTRRLIRLSLPSVTGAGAAAPTLSGHRCRSGRSPPRAFVIGLAPNQVHALRVEDVVVEDLVIEGVFVGLIRDSFGY